VEVVVEEVWGLERKENMVKEMERSDMRKRECKEEESKNVVGSRNGCTHEGLPKGSREVGSNKEKREISLQVNNRLMEGGPNLAIKCGYKPVAKGN
jgi:hypothetical protein